MSRGDPGPRRGRPDRSRPGRIKLSADRKEEVVSMRLSPAYQAMRFNCWTVFIATFSTHEASAW